jgi:hypothetical protein
VALSLEAQNLKTSKTWGRLPLLIFTLFALNLFQVQNVCEFSVVRIVEVQT